MSLRELAVARSGSGTTLLVAERLGRDSLGLELNPEYVRLAWRRIRGPLFAEPSSIEPTGLDNKQRQLGKRTYAGFNDRWKASQQADDGVGA